MTESGHMQEFEELLARYNRAFYDRDLVALRALYVPDVEVPYFDNHANGDSTDLETHLEKVATFFETDDIVPLLVENVRAFVHGDAACVVAMVRYSAQPVPGVRVSFFLERHATAWRIRHIHFRRMQVKQAHNTCIEIARYAGRVANLLRGLAAAHTCGYPAQVAE